MRKEPAKDGFEIDCTTSWRKVTGHKSHGIRFTVKRRMNKRFRRRAAKEIEQRLQDA